MGQHFVRPSRAVLRARADVVAPLVAQGLSQAEIVRRTGLSQQWVSAWVRSQRDAAGMTMRGRDDRTRAALEARRVAAVQAYQNGMLQVEIARRWKVTAAAVNQWVKALSRGGESALRRAATTGRPKREATP